MIILFILQYCKKKKKRHQQEILDIFIFLVIIRRIKLGKSKHPGKEFGTLWHCKSGLITISKNTIFLL